MTVSVFTLKTFCQKYFEQNVSLRRSGKDQLSSIASHDKRVKSFKSYHSRLRSLRVHFEVIFDSEFSQVALVLNLTVTFDKLVYHFKYFCISNLFKSLM